MTIAQYIWLAIGAAVVVTLAVKWASVRKNWLAGRLFFSEVKVEMQKVSWPSKNDVIGSTMVVIAATVSISLVITIWDQVLSWVLQGTLSIFGMKG